MEAVSREGQMINWSKDAEIPTYCVLCLKTASKSTWVYDLGPKHSHASQGPAGFIKDLSTRHQST